jgi:hypothetical protein
MMHERFATLVHSVEAVFAPRIPGDASANWPDPIDAGLHEDNIVEFSTSEYETFARWFDEHGDIEVLVVITNVHPTKDFSDFIEEVSDTLPDDLEIDNPACEIGTPICVAYTWYSDDSSSSGEIEHKLRQLRALAEFVAQEVAV